VDCTRREERKGVWLLDREVLKRWCISTGLDDALGNLAWAAQNAAETCPFAFSRQSLEKAVNIRGVITELERAMYSS
jgi:hypothetical protein